ncbi:MAG: ribosome recycling factor [candidate division Zixibacteria bacterium]|nr:ribosome recycling factor [candidate division Zixibacteria bacterium]
MLKEIKSDAERRMQKTIESMQTDLAGIRSGQVTPALLDSVKVDAYGQKTPLNQVASVSVPDPKSLLVQPWDKGILGEVVKAIQAAELGLNPQAEANLVRIPIPPLSEERRMELVKLCKKIAEDNRVAVRNIRRDANDKLKKAEKDKAVSEDQMHDGMDTIQKLTDKFIKEIDVLMDAKEKEVMAV